MVAFGTPHPRLFWLDLPVRWRGTLIVAIPVTCLLTAVAAFAILQRNTEAAQKYIDRTEQKIFQANLLLKTLVDAETGVRGYDLTLRPEFLQPYNNAIAILPDSVDKLNSLVQDNSQQHQQMQQIRSLVQQEMSLLMKNLATVKTAKSANGLLPQLEDLLVKQKATMDAIRKQIAAFSSQEEQLLNQQNQQLKSQRLMTAFVLGSSAAIGLLGSLAAVYLFDQLDRQLIERQTRTHESNVRLQAILDNVVDGIITIDKRGRIQSFNQAAIQMFGYEPDQVIGKNLKLLFHNSFSGDSSEILGYFVGGTDLAKMRCLQEMVGRRQNGTAFPIELAFSEMHLRDRHLFIAIVRDIQARKSAEETLRKQATLLDLANDAIAVRDRDARITYWNQGAELLYGWKKAEVIGKSIYNLLQTEFPQPLTEIENKFFEEGYWKGELIQTKRDGTRITVASRWTLQTDDEGEPVATLEIGNDITERKSSEEALLRKATELAQLSAILAQTNAILEKRNSELDQFAYIVSHDLKAPLRAIANLSTWIEEDIQDQLNDDTRHNLDLLRRRVKRMENLIDGLLQYSRIGRVKSEIELVNVGSLIEDVIDSLAPPSEFTITVVDSMPVLKTERLSLEQVFANTIGNAIKHHHRSDGRVTISVEDKGDFYEFAIADNGPGIAPEYHEKVFAIFQTLEARDKVDSTGIGLSIVKKIVESQRGTIRLESQTGQGATFRFTWSKMFIDNS